MVIVGTFSVTFLKFQINWNHIVNEFMLSFGEPTGLESEGHSCVIELCLPSVVCTRAGNEQDSQKQMNIQGANDNDKSSPTRPFLCVITIVKPTYECHSDATVMIMSGSGSWIYILLFGERTGVESEGHMCYELCLPSKPHVLEQGMKGTVGHKCSRSYIVRRGLSCDHNHVIVCCQLDSHYGDVEEYEMHKGARRRQSKLKSKPSTMEVAQTEGRVSESESSCIFILRPVIHAWLQISGRKAASRSSATR